MGLIPHQETKILQAASMAQQNKTKQKTKPKQTKNLGGKNEMDSRVFPKYLFTEIILVLFATDV